MAWSEKAIEEALTAFYGHPWQASFDPSDEVLVGKVDDMRAALDAAAAIDGDPVDVRTITAYESGFEAGKDEGAAERDRLQGRVATLEKAFTDRNAADRKAWKAIMEKAGRTQGIPPDKEVVAYYVTEVERLEKEGHEARMAEHQTFMAAAAINVENDSLRAKLDRVGAKLSAIQRHAGKEGELATCLDEILLSRVSEMVDEALSELSTLAPKELP